MPRPRAAAPEGVRGVDTGMHYRLCGGRITLGAPPAPPARSPFERRRRPCHPPRSKRPEI
jgi:hypothetical protein